MKLNRKIILMLCCGVSLVVWLTGCAMLPKNKIAKSTTNFNLVVERAANEMLLLNIVRASKRHPMYFTGLTTIRGSLSYEVSTGEITIPFGKIGSGYNGAYSAVSPALKYSSNPVFDVNVLDNKEFYDAMMTPVPLETIDYFFQQGWPREMLLHLFIRCIDYYDKKGEMKSLRNYPGDEEEFIQFQTKLREIFSGELNIEVKKTSQSIENKIKVKDKNKKKIRVIVAEPGVSLPTTEKKEGTYILHLRSPEAILYYLGEIIRAEMKGKPFIPTIKLNPKRCAEKPDAPLFVVHKKTYKDKSPIVTVTYEGTTYVIPKSSDDESSDECSVDRSMHVLSLVSLIIGKQKTSTPVPSTGVVSIIGR